MPNRKVVECEVELSQSNSSIKYLIETQWVEFYVNIM
jgi:hypothetical protein